VTVKPSARLTARWLRARLPAPTIRLRLTLIYGGLFLCSSAAVLALTFFLVRHQYTDSFFTSSARRGVVSVVPTSTGPSSISPQPGGLPGTGPGGLPSVPVIIRAAVRYQSNAALNELLIASGIALAIMAALSIWVGWVIAGRALRPLRTITDAAREISASNLHRRLALTGPDDELKHLGTTFDGLLARLEASFDAQRQFVANASHELRTPLTLERTLLELALSDPTPTVDSYRHTCEQLLAVGHQQEHLIEALLTLSRSQRGLDRHQPVDLAAITAAAVAAAHHHGLPFDTSLDPAEATGDPRLVERLVANLIDNAITHNTAGGRVEITTGSRGNRAVLTVTNTGAPISAGEIERIFQPFQRLDATRTADGNGLGLGLSIVKAIADAHDATIAAVPQPDGGLRIKVDFPALGDARCGSSVPTHGDRP
jgi:signal transduction histidine kinase